MAQATKIDGLNNNTGNNPPGNDNAVIDNDNDNDNGDMITIHDNNIIYSNVQ